MKIRAHESFYLRKGWLHKGVKNIVGNVNLEGNDRLFNDKEIDACSILGIGANQVKALKYWLLATGITEETVREGLKVQALTEFGQTVNNLDPYFEEVGTNMFVHYKLASNLDMATAWYWLFNVYDGMTIDKSIFVRDLNSYITFDLNEKESKVLEDEFNCILKTYIVDEKEDDPEEIKICPLSEFGLLELVDKKTKEIKKTSPDIDDIHPMVAYAVICDNLNGRDEIKIDELCSKPNNLGRIFNLNRTAIIGLLDKLSKMNYVSIVRTAGLDVIKINNVMIFIECMETYYAMLGEE